MPSILYWGDAESESETILLAVARLDNQSHDAGGINSQQFAVITRNRLALYHVIRVEKTDELTVVPHFGRHASSLADNETMSISKQRVKIAQTAKSVGSGSDVALLKAEVDYKTDSSNLVQQDLGLRNLKADLNQLLGRTPDTPFEVAEQLAAAKPMAYQETVAKAMEQNSSLIEARQTLSIQQLGVKEVRSTMLPTVTLNSSYTFNKYSYTNGSYDALRTHGPYVGVTAGLTLFNGFNTRRNERNAQLQANSTEIEVQQLEQELRTSILKTYNAYTTAQSVVEIEKKHYIT